MVAIENYDTFSHMTHIESIDWLSMFIPVYACYDIHFHSLIKIHVTLHNLHITFLANDRKFTRTCCPFAKHEGKCVLDLTMSGD